MLKIPFLCVFGKFAAVNSGTIPFQAYRAVSSSRSKYIEHTNALRERDEGQKSNLWSRKGELSSSLFFPGYMRIWNRFLDCLIRL